MGAIYNITVDSTVAADNSTFDVFNGAGVTLTGSGNTVAVQPIGPVNFYDTIYDVNGNNNSVLIDSSITQGQVTLNGTGNVVQGGDGTIVFDNCLQSGAGNTITVGANSSVDVQNGVSGDTINATAGGTRILTGWNSVTINGNNDQIRMFGSGAAAQINGNGNVVQMMSNDTLNLNGSNNTISGSSGESITMTGGGNAITLNAGNNSIYFSANSGAQTIQNGSGVMLYELADGEIYWNQPATLSLHGGIATLGFTDGTNIAISGVRSASGESNLGADNQVTQLVSAMASYSGGAGGLSSTLTTQTSAVPTLFASAHN